MNRFNYRIDDLVVNMGHYDLTISGDSDLSFSWVDFGIGSYEFWGNRGFDTSWGPEEVFFTGVYLESKTNADGEEVDVSSKEIIDALNRMIDENDKFRDTVDNRITEYMNEEPDDY